MQITFTESSITTLRPGWHRDRTQPGLSLYVGKSGSRTYYWYRWVPGKGPVRHRLDATNAITLATARRTVERMNGAKANGEDPSEARRAASRAPTLREVAELYFADRVAKGKRRVADMRAIAELYFLTLPTVDRKPHGRTRTKPAEGVDWSRRKLDAVTDRDVALLHHRIGARAPTTANRVVEVISAIYGHAIKGKLAQSNPAANIEPFAETERARFLREDELPRFIAALGVTPQPWQDFLRVLLATGARRSSVQAMRWADVDLEQQLWHVPAAQSKSGDQLVIPLTSDACAVLRRRDRDSASPWVFPGGSAEGHVTQPKKAWASLLIRAELTDLHLHDVRRSLGSWMAMSGASLPVIGKALGHGAALSATGVYARLAAAPVRQAMEKAQAQMRKAGSAKRKLRVVA